MKNQNNLKNIEISRTLCPTSNGMKKLTLLFLVLASMSFALPVFAQSDKVITGLGVDTKLANPLKSDLDTFPKFVAGVTNTAVQVLMPFVVLSFIYAGFLFVKAQGNPKELEEARAVIWYSVIGAFILFGAYGFAQIIGETVSTITKTTP